MRRRRWDLEWVRVENSDLDLNLNWNWDWNLGLSLGLGLDLVMCIEAASWTPTSTRILTVFVRLTWQAASADDAKNLGPSRSPDTVAAGGCPQLIDCPDRATGDGISELMLGLRLSGDFSSAAWKPHHVIKCRRRLTDSWLRTLSSAVGTRCARSAGRRPDSQRHGVPSVAYKWGVPKVDNDINLEWAFQLVFYLKVM